MVMPQLGKCRLKMIKRWLRVNYEGNHTMFGFFLFIWMWVKIRVLRYHQEKVWICWVYSKDEYFWSLAPKNHPSNSPIPENSSVLDMSWRVNPIHPYDIST